MGFLLFPGATMAVAEAPRASLAPVYEVAMTAYNAVPEQTDDSPFETASGAYSNPEIIAARSQDLANELPFGTIIEIDGPLNKQNGCGYSVVSPIMGYRIIADTMNVKFTKRVDILFDTDANYKMSGGRTMNASEIMGVCHSVSIRVVGHIDPTQMGHLPKTQKELAAIVEGHSEKTLAVK